MAKTFWKCRICGDIHYGQEFPETCPTCQTKDAYDAIEKENAKNEMGL